MDGLAIGQHQGGIARIFLGQLAQTKLHKLGGVHRVISKQNVFLHHIDLDAGVMLDARTCNIKALGAKVEQRLFRTVESVPFAINDRVIDLI